LKIIFQKQINISLAVDKINDRWGEHVVTPALMSISKKTIIDSIAFGSSR